MVKLSADFKNSIININQVLNANLEVALIILQKENKISQNKHSDQNYLIFDLFRMRRSISARVNYHL